MKREQQTNSRKTVEIEENDKQVERKEPWYSGLLYLLSHLGELLIGIFQ